MAANLTMVRIATKLDDLFNEKIDTMFYRYRKEGRV